MTATWPLDVPSPRCAPRGEREQRPAAALREQRNDPRYLRRLVGEARADVHRAAREVAELLLLVRLGALEREGVPHDVLAERRVLAALALGRFRVRDVADLPLDVWAPQHRVLAAILLALLELEAAPTRATRASSTWPRRPGAARRDVLEELVARLDEAAGAQLAGLPWPGEAPREELAEVRARSGRRRSKKGG